MTRWRAANRAVGARIARKASKGSAAAEGRAERAAKRGSIVAMGCAKVSRAQFAKSAQRKIARLLDGTAQSGLPFIG